MALGDSGSVQRNPRVSVEAAQVTVTSEITKWVTLQVGATAQNLTNTEQFGNPNTNISSTSIGRLPAAPFPTPVWGPVVPLAL